MKEKIVGVLSLPYLDKYVVKVFRQIDRFHVPTERIYIAPYSNPDKVWHLFEHFSILNALVTKDILVDRITRWQKS